MVMLAHMLPDDAIAAISANVRTAMGRPGVSVAAGSSADLVALNVRTPREALAFGPTPRLVMYRGRVVASTSIR